MFASGIPYSLNRRCNGYELSDEHGDLPQIDIRR